MVRFLRSLSALAVVLAAGTPFAAAAPEGGTLAAERACPAYQSFRQETNPGGVTLEPGRTYPVTAENRPNGTHVRIRVDGAEPPLRWVEKSCGRLAGAIGEAAPGRARAEMGGGEGRTQYVLAASWQPAFCEGQPRRPECRTQGEDRADASRFSLHGLWPQPRRNEYCGVSPEIRKADEDGDWADLPMPELSAPVRAELDDVMPGTRSHLDRHEWIRHGTCYGEGAEAYFADSLVVMRALNGSEVAKLFRGRIGGEVRLEEVRAAFDASFGAGAGERVRISCRNDGARRLVTELTIGLTGRIETEADVPRLILAAAPTEGGCERGVVDPAGLQ